jgi:hypothetical protein
MDSGETGISRKVIHYTRKWSEPGISDGEDSSGGSFDDDEGRESAQGSSERIYRRERMRWDAPEGDVCM